MYDVMCFDLEANTVTINTDETHFLTIGHKETDFKNLLQCTGLKDKNGKLIFEGDIVDILPEVETTGIIKWSDDLARFVIVYENIQCDFDNYYGYELEVIGNIYENPELLESEEQ